MSKAEDRAKEIYKGDTPITKLRRKDYCDGYHQAEEDLELTWEDMLKIDEIISEVYKCIHSYNTAYIYQEVLKRFKERKKT